MNILIINQNEDFCGMLSRFLVLEGHSASCVSNEAKGFESVASIRPDLVIIEVSMPEISAIEIVKRLQRGSETRAIPIILISDFIDLEIELLHIFDFIHKPVDLVRLREDLEMLSQGMKKRELHLNTDHLSPEEHHMFHDFLIDHSGLHFEKRNIKMLERGLLNRIAALRMSSFCEYYDFLSKNREKRAELQKLLQFLTVGETFFFRYHTHFAALAKNLLPLVLKQKEQQPLRFWSAGCSTGEEPYSIAMTIMETLPDWKNRDIKIVATDINNRALRRASEGVYSPWKVRVTEQKYLDKYFKRIGESYIVRDEVKSLVEFSHINLQTLTAGAPFALSESFDAIFCRNVMIYFKTETTRKVVETLASSLKPGGALFLGHAETLTNISAKFDRHLQDGGFYYTKKLVQPSPQLNASPKMQPVKSKTAFPLSSASLPVNKETVDKAPAPPPATEITPDLVALYIWGTTLLEQENFVEAEKIFQQVLCLEPEHPGAMLAIALILANNGRLKEALASCNRVIAINDLLPEAYYLRGLLYEMTDREEDAVHEYRKAILLKMDFVMPHYQLGKLYYRSGEHKLGTRELKNSLKILEKSGRETIIPYSGGLSREVFLGQLREEMIRVDSMMAA
jgi:chemotaxis protein methyltransferase CheR